jgi:integrase
VLCTLLRYAKQRDYIDKLPHFSRKTPAPHRVRWLSPDEEQKVFAAIETADYLIARKHREEMSALTRILIDTGMRRGEVLGLKPENIDGDWVRLWKTKNGKARSVPLTPKAKELLLKHVPFEIKDHQVHRFWAKVRDQVGLSKDTQFVLHTLRHTTATRMLKKTKNIAMVQRMLGHSNISTTLRYAHIDDQDLLDAVNS